MSVIPAGNNRQLARVLSSRKPAFTVNHSGKFAESHAVYYRQRQPPYTRFIALAEKSAVNVKAVGVRPVKNDYLLAVLSAGIHQVIHRNIVGVVPKPYVLHVHNKNIKLRHVLASR